MRGFYKAQDGELLHAPNFVYGPYNDFVLLASEKDEYLALDVLPIDGWYWFDSEEEARTALNVPLPEPAE